MAIIIENYHMPDTCSECQIMRVHSKENRVYCGVTGKALEIGRIYKNRGSKCPLRKVENENDLWCEDCTEYDHKNNWCPRWNRVIRKTVNELKNKWLKWNRCEECLPAYRGYYLVTLDKGAGWRKVVIELFQDGKWFFHNKDSVIAWAELPDPYQGE